MMASKYPIDFFFTVVINVKFWQEQEQQKPKKDQRDMAFFLLTETNLPHDLKEDYPNGNLILREDYQKSFKKEVRWRDIKSFLKTESIGEVYRSYSNGEKIGMCVVHPGKIEFTMVLIGANKL